MGVLVLLLIGAGFASRGSAGPSFTLIRSGRTARFAQETSMGSSRSGKLHISTWATQPPKKDDSFEPKITKRTRNKEGNHS